MSFPRLRSIVLMTAVSQVTPATWAQAPGSAQLAQGRQPAAAGAALAPRWIPLPPDHEKYLNQILNFWEHTTSKTKRYRCQFKRWEYGNQNLKTYSAGSIKYAAPDKGLFKVDAIQIRQAPRQPGGEPQWVEQQGGFREHWVCDGKSIFEFDHQNKQLKQRQLPQDLQGTRITDGPLPFLFGATAKQIKARLWLRVVTPPETKGEYWLEGVPKTKTDAANFARINIILDEKDFLPKGMVLFHRNQAQTTFAFERREMNWNIIAQQLNPFMRQFFEPKTPPGWKKVVEPVGPRPDVARELQRRQLR